MYRRLDEGGQCVKNLNQLLFKVYHVIKITGQK